MEIEILQTIVSKNYLSAGDLVFQQQIHSIYEVAEVSEIHLWQNSIH